MLPVVDFINICCPPFLYKIESRSYILLHFSFVIFGAKILYKKCALKMLMKLKAVADTIKLIFLTFEEFSWFLIIRRLGHFTLNYFFNKHSNLALKIRKRNNKNIGNKHSNLALKIRKRNNKNIGSATGK